jgi:putative hemolysin
MESLHSVGTTFTLFAALILYALFLLAVFSLLKARRPKLRELAKREFLGARLARLILGSHEHYLLSTVVGLSVASILVGLTTIASIDVLTSSIDSQWGTALISILLVGVAAALVTLVSQCVRVFTIAHGERVLALLSPIIIFWGRLLRPLTQGSILLVRKILSIASWQPEREAAPTAEEISEIVELSSKAGAIEEEKKEMIKGVFEFSATVVREVMTPRADIISVCEDAGLDEVKAIFLSEQVSRLLVTGRSLDEVRGVLIAKDLMKYLGSSGADFVLKHLVRPAFMVPNNRKVNELLHDLRRRGMHFAVVLDEHGGVDGVVTVEDLVEEIVGDIFDEYDSPADDLPVRKLKGGDLLIEGSIAIEDLNATYRLSLPCGEYDTLAGYVIHLLGRIPVVGETVESEGVRIRVEEADNNRVTKLRIIVEKINDNNAVGA